MWFWKAVWQAVRLVLPFNQVKGCGLHWTQCLFRQLKKIVFVSAYRSHKNVKVFCKQVLCFHLLPVTKIENVFYRFLSSVPTVINKRDTQKLIKKNVLVCAANMNNKWKMVHIFLVPALLENKERRKSGKAAQNFSGNLNQIAIRTCFGWPRPQSSKQLNCIMTKQLLICLIGWQSA